VPAAADDGPEDEGVPAEFGDCDCAATPTVRAAVNAIVPAILNSNNRRFIDMNP
jgi:hypothetical protein